VCRWTPPRRPPARCSSRARCGCRTAPPTPTRRPVRRWSCRTNFRRRSAAPHAQRASGPAAGRQRQPIPPGSAQGCRGPPRRWCRASRRACRGCRSRQCRQPRTGNARRRRRGRKPGRAGQRYRRASRPAVPRPRAGSAPDAPGTPAAASAYPSGPVLSQGLEARPANPRQNRATTVLACSRCANIRERPGTAAGARSSPLGCRPCWRPGTAARRDIPAVSGRHRSAVVPDARLALGALVCPPVGIDPPARQFIARGRAVRVGGVAQQVIIGADGTRGTRRCSRGVPGFFLQTQRRNTGNTGNTGIR
jgi:hypothetical protein